MMKANVEIKMQSVSSRDIALVGYDKDSSTLEVVFRAGGVYRYQEVPQSVHQEFMKSSSLGTFFQDNIKNNYSYIKVR